MRCLYCETPVYGDKSITVTGKGPAHKICLDFELSSMRVFQGIDLKTLSVQELDEMIAAAQEEKQARKGRLKIARP